MSKIDVIVKENSALTERAEDTLLLGLAAEIIYQTEDSVHLLNQILERISTLKDIPFCACLERGVEGLAVEGFYASFAPRQKSEVTITFSETSAENLQTDGYLVITKSEFSSYGFRFEMKDELFQPAYALIIPCFCKGIYNRYFVFLDNNESDRFSSMLVLMQQVVKLAAEKLVNIFMYGELNRLNRELDRRVKERTEELTLVNKCLNREISERKIIEKALRANERKLRSVYNAAIDVSFITFDLTDKFIVRSYSPGAEKMFGYLPQEVVGKSIEFFHFFNPSEFSQALRRDFETLGWSRHDEIILKRKSGESFTSMLTIYPLFDEDLKLMDALAVCIDISELKHTQNQLILALERAEENDRLKTSFLQNMSHEIRTPLNAILGFADLLPEYFDDEKALYRFAGIIKEKGTDLLGIISDVLDIARIESGQIVHSPEYCRMDEVFVEIERKFRESANPTKREAVEFRLNVPQNIRNLDVKIDQLKLSQILSYLLGNAFKFTASGKIELGCSKNPESDEFTFYIADTGIGISNEKHSEIFNRFTQASNNASQLYGGNGLGLSIVKGLLDLMGGKIWLESQVGVGTTFYFSVPFATSDWGSEPWKEAQPDFDFDFSDELILIVEDDEYNTSYLKEVLRDSGFSFQHCRYGKKAIDVCIDQEINIVLLDPRLPDITGYEVIRQIKRINPTTKIIVQTAYATSEDKEMAFEAGCDDYLSKPIKLDLLISRIKFYLQYFRHQFNN